MAPAFVPSSFKPVALKTSFTGTHLTCSRPTHAAANTTMKYSLDNYAKYSEDTSPKPDLSPSKPSAIWSAYNTSVKGRFNVFEKAKDTKPSVPYSAAAVLAATTPYFLIQGAAGAAAFGAGGDPDNMLNNAPRVAADKYMASCITEQYKMTAVPYGIYNVQCTEGTTRGQAEYARSLALSAEFRMKQRTTAQKFGDFCETRRKAISAAHGCTYEEKLVDKYPISARAFLRGASEAKNVCVRYAQGASVVEKYMADCVDKQSKFRAVPMGEYDVLCNDGNTSGVAEYKRVQALSARFRANQLPAGVKEAVKYESAKYARDNFGHGCNYEEKYFNSYPAVAASMRPSTARY